MSNVQHGVFEYLIPVRSLHQTVKQRADFALAWRRHFVVMHLNRDALLFQSQAHGGADILQRIDRRHGEITAFNRRAMAHIATIKILA